MVLGTVNFTHRWSMEKKSGRDSKTQEEGHRKTTSMKHGMVVHADLIGLQNITGVHQKRPTIFYHIDISRYKAVYPTRPISTRLARTNALSIGFISRTSRCQYRKVPNMGDGLEADIQHRGKALLVIAMIIAAYTFAFLILPRAFGPPELTVRVAVIDSGINQDNEIAAHIVAEASFVNSTYGFSTNMPGPIDSEPQHIQHGTSVTRIIIRDAPNAAIINAKVVSSQDIATSRAVVAAIHWSVQEENCDIINLSIGRSPEISDDISAAIQWAWSQGVVIVAATGNNGQNGTTGSSVESPAIYPEVIAVTAVDESGIPYTFSGYGPVIGRVLKPDIAAPGYYLDNSVTLLGTSFAAPRVTAAAANLIRYCQENEWRWTPGMVKATLLASASYLDYEPWQVGAGLVDVDSAKKYLHDSEKVNGLPMVAFTDSSQGIFDFERWFLNSTNEITVQISASSNATFVVRKTGTLAPFITGPETFYLNQSGQIEYSVRVSAGTAWKGITGLLTFASDEYEPVSTEIKFDAAPYTRKIAFDFSHTTWSTDSIFGQFRSAYSKITESGIAVEEIRRAQNISLAKFRQYDAIIIVDPCAWQYTDAGESDKPNSSIRYTDQQLDVYRTYWQKGGNLMIIGGSNDSLDLYGANQLLSLFNMSLNYDQAPLTYVVANGVAGSIPITNITEHTVTSGIVSFDYNGASLNVSDAASVLAYGLFTWMYNGTFHSAPRPVLVSEEQNGVSRLLVTGSNFFIDNWGQRGIYGSKYDTSLMRRCIYWLTGLF